MHDIEDIKSLLVASGLVPLKVVAQGGVQKPGERPFELYEVTLAVPKALTASQQKELP